MALDTSTGIVKPEEGFNVIKAAAEQRASTTFASIKAHELMDQQEAAAREMQTATMAEGLNKATISEAESSFAANSDAKKAAQNLALGFDPLDQGSKSNYWIREMHENAAKAYAALDVVNEGTSKTLLNDPLGFISAQFTLPADIAAQHYYVDKYNAAAGSLNEITQASSAASIAINQSQQTTSVAMASAKADNAMQLATLAAAKIKHESAGIQKAGVIEIDQLNAKQLALAVQVHAVQNSDAHLALAQQSAADSHAMHLRNMELAQANLDKKSDDDVGWQAQMDNYNAGARAGGKVIYDSVQMFKKAQAQYGSSDNFKNTVVYGMGILANNGNPVGVPVAPTAGIAAANYAAGGTRLVGNVAGTYLAEEWNKAKLSPTASKDPIALAAAVDKQAVAGANNQLRSIDNSNPQVHNIYQAPIPAVLFKSTAVMSNPFLATTLAPIVELDKRATITDETLVAKAAAYAQQNPGAGNFNVAAAGIATYYQAAMAKNNMVNMYVENGLPPQKTYVAKISGRDINLASQADVKRALFLMSGNSQLGSSPFGFR